MIVDPRQIRKLRWPIVSADIAVKIIRPKPFIPLAIRAHFALGTGTASLTLAIFETAFAAAGTLLGTIAGLGTTGSDLNWRLADAEAHAWQIDPDEAFAIAWTNPNTGTMTYNLTVKIWEP